MGNETPFHGAATTDRDFVRSTSILWRLKATLDPVLLLVSGLVTNAVINARRREAVSRVGVS